MRIRRLDLTRYGKFTDKVLDFGAAEAGKPDFHIVYGLNEAGKSTAFSAYLDLLFGIPLKTQYSFLHPNESMQIGGLLEFDDAEHELVRTKKRANTLIDPRGQPVNEAIIASALGGIGRAAYRTMFSLDDQSLKDGGEDILKSEGDLGALLFSTSSGLADISRVLDTMRLEADSLYRERASKTELAHLKARLASLKEKRGEIDIQASAFTVLAAAEAQAAKAHEAAETELAAQRLRQAELARLLRALPAAGELKRLEAALLPFSDLPRPGRELLALLPRLVQDETRLETRRRGIEEALEKLRAEHAAIGADEALLALSPRIVTLTESRARFHSAEPDLPNRRAELSRSEGALALLLQALGRTGEPNPSSLILPARLVSRLRDLIERRSGTDASLAASEREVRRIRTLVEEATRERAALGDTADAEGGWQRLATLAERLQRSDRPARLSSEERILARLTSQVEAARTALGPSALPPEELKRLALPDRRQMQRWRDTAVDLARRRRSHDERIRTLETDIEQAKARSAAIRDGAEALDDVSAQRVRGERDRLWQAHLKRLDRESASEFEAALHRDDVAALLRLSRAQDLAELRQAENARRLGQAALERERDLMAEAEEENGRLADAIRQAAPEGLPEVPDIEDRLARLQVFIDRHAAWLEACANWEEAERRVAELRDEIRAGLDMLSAALAALGIKMSAKPTAEALFDLTERHLAAAEKQASHRNAVEEREKALKAELAERLGEHRAALDGVAVWQAEWKTALAQTWFGKDATTGEVRAVLDALAGLPALLAERQDLAHRIDAMEQNRQAFRDEVTAICRLVGLAADGDDIRAADMALMARHAAALRAAEAQEEKLRQIAEREAELDGLEDKIARHGADRTRLLESLAVETLEAASGQVERLAERDLMEARRRELTAQLIADLRTDDLESAVAMLGEMDRARLEAEQGLVDERIERLTGEARDLYGRLIVARSRIEQIGGDGAVAALEAERATVLLAMEDLALRYLKLRTGALAAGSALDLYRERHRSTMMKRASEAFRMITRGDYSGLSARPDKDKDKETLIGIPREGGSRLTDAMSTGTRYQLYLALRLAGYREFAEVRPPVPFIADDIMETFDEPRSEEVFRLFGEISGIGQVIYLTHHRHLCDIARAVVPDVRIHAL